MADWESLSVTPQKDGDVMSLFTTKSASPLYTMNGHVSELSFTPLKNGASGGGGASGDPHTGHASFCQADTVEQCIASINQVGLPYSRLYATNDMNGNCQYYLNAIERFQSYSTRRCID